MPSPEPTGIRYETGAPEFGGQPFYMTRSQYAYWKHTQLIIDVVPGRGGMFSLEGPTGQRFLTRSRLFSDDEVRQLEQAENAQP